jgi:hypothetical protein
MATKQITIKLAADEFHDIHLISDLLNSNPHRLICRVLSAWLETGDFPILNKTEKTPDP